MKTTLNGVVGAVLGLASFLSVGLFSGDAGATWRTCTQVVSVTMVKAAAARMALARPEVAHCFA